MVIVFDLDDTLYDEIDFVKSGFKEVSNFLGNEKLYDFMWESFFKHGSGKIFDMVIDNFGLKDVTINKLVEVYKFHYPNIKLPRESVTLLDLLKNQYISLITDGHYITQKNKFEALKLGDFIKNPIFTDCYNTTKFYSKPFEMVEQRFPSDKYLYIGDNPLKDFSHPKQLGWSTIRFRNCVGIYKDLPTKEDLNYEVDSREELIEILKKIV